MKIISTLRPNARILAATMTKAIYLAFIGANLDKIC